MPYRGDQGFLNTYFENFVNAPLFEAEKEAPKDTKVCYAVEAVQCVSYRNV